MLKKTKNKKKLFKYIAYISGLTVLASILAIRFRLISDLIIKYDKTILLIAVIVLFFGLLFQKKQNDVLRDNERLYHELQEKQKMIDRDLAMAKNIQQAILNEPLPKLSGLALTAKCIPAHQIGGDFYCLKKIGHELHFFIGDVSGHGISSALVMSLTHGVMNEIITYLNSPAQILTMTNKLLCHYLQNSINFVTIFYGKIDTQTKELVYCGAGHPPALLLSAKGEPKFLASVGPILGIFANNEYKNNSVKLKAGERLFIYTDGFTECKDESGEELGEKGFVDIVVQDKKLPIGKLNELLYKKIIERDPDIKDDLSSIIIEVVN